MQRIITLLDKIRELNSRPNISQLDVDLMMDYTRVMYADMLEWKNKIAFTDNLDPDKHPSTDIPPVRPEPVGQLQETVAPAQAADNIYAAEKTQIPLSVNTHIPAQPHYSNADIRKSIGINDKYQFISELFGNNKDAYEQVLHELNTFDKEEEALTWISNSVFNQYNWQDDSEAVQSFFKLLGDFYAAR